MAGGAAGGCAALAVERALAVARAVVAAAVVAEDDVFGAGTGARVRHVHAAQEVATRRARIQIVLKHDDDVTTV